MNNVINSPVRDTMLVENAKPHDAPHPVRDATTAFRVPSLRDGGCVAGHPFFYQYHIPNGITT